MQLALGVAYWVLPRLRRDGPPVRGRETAAWLSYALLNTGLLLAAGAVAFPGLGPVALGLGRLAEAVAAGLFAWHAWPRVRAAGKGAG
jgi:hypothetical protein